MNNKRLGTQFEQVFCRLLADRLYWVHFITPSYNGGQPFDVIAVKNGLAYAYDCKTSASNKFPLTRLEQNQILAFEKWISCGNTMPNIAVLHNGYVYIIPYNLLKERKVVNLEENLLFA